MSDNYKNLDIIDQIIKCFDEYVVIIDSKSTIKASTKEVQHLFGYEKKYFIGQNIKILLPFQFCPKKNEYIQNIKMNDFTKHLDIQSKFNGQNKDGSMIDLDLKVSKVDFENESFYIVKMYNTYSTNSSNLTIQNQAELLERAEKIGHIGHWRADLVNNSIFWSKEVYRIHGVSPKNFKPDLQSAINFYIKEDREMVQNEVQTSIETTSDFTFEAKIKRPSDELRYVRSSGECTVDSNGNVTSIFGIFQDITKETKAYKALKETQNAMVSLNEELEEFAYRTSHDLRSPLVSSISLLGIIKEYIVDDYKDKAIVGIDAIQTSLTELEILVDDILTLTKAKHIQEKAVAINFSNLVQTALKKAKGLKNYERLHIHINIDLERDFISKKSHLTLIIENLISNAVKYQDPKKDSSFLKISVLENENSVEFAIEDNGLGIPEKNQKYLFSMFKRFHPKISFGSGLGLYMLKKSVDNLNGQILFENTGQGSKFKVTIPY